MKLLLSIIALSSIVAFPAYAYMDCSLTNNTEKKELPLLSVEITGSEKIQARVTKTAISNQPESFTCIKRVGDVLRDSSVITSFMCDNDVKSMSFYLIEYPNGEIFGNYFEIKRITGEEFEYTRLFCSPQPKSDSVPTTKPTEPQGIVLD